MTRVALNRRRFLRCVGATALTYPFLRGVPSYAGPNNGGTSPVNLILLFTSCGTVRYQWGAQGPAPTGTTPTSTAVTNGPLAFRQRLSAFTKAGPNGQADVTKYITVLDGLQNKAAGGGSHEPGMASLWTGLPSNGSPVTGPSIDQVISSVSPKTPFGNVALLVQSAPDMDAAGIDSRMLYTLQGGFANPITTPGEAVSRLFPTAMASAGPDKKSLIRAQVLQHLNADLTSLKSRLCTEDRQQLQNLQDLWNSVVSGLDQAASAAAMCMVPSTDAGSPTTGSCAPPIDPFYAYSQVMPNILTLTLACGLTNVASLQYSQAHSATTHCWLGSTQTNTHHNYSHTGPTYLGALGPDLYNEPSSVATTVVTKTDLSNSNIYSQQLVDIENWYAQQIANLAYSLSQFGPAGSTLLDNSVICWGTEVDMGFAHNHDNTPFVLIGGAGGKLLCSGMGGQLVRFPLLNLGNGVTQNGAGVRFHNDLLLTLAQIMGVSEAQVQAAYGRNWSAFNQYVNSPIAEILRP
jgi:hypothetical protein